MPNPGHGGEEAGEGRSGEEEGNCLLFDQARLDSTFFPLADVGTEVDFDYGSLSPRRKRKATEEEMNVE